MQVLSTLEGSLICHQCERTWAWTWSTGQLRSFLQWAITNHQNNLCGWLISVQIKIRCLSEIYVLAEIEIFGLMCHSGKTSMLTRRSLKTFVFSWFWWDSGPSLKSAHTLCNSTVFLGCNWSLSVLWFRIFRLPLRTDSHPHCGYSLQFHC